MDDADVTVEPRSAIAWYPHAPALAEPAQQSFAELDAAEFRGGKLASALELSGRLAAHSDLPTHAVALLRQAALLRKLHRISDATAIYRQLADIRTVAINGEPIDLVARRTLCQLAAEDQRQAVALNLRADLSSGRWTLNRITYRVRCFTVGFVAWIRSNPRLRPRSTGCGSRMAGPAADERGGPQPDRLSRVAAGSRTTGHDRLGYITGARHGDSCAPGVRRSRVASRGFDCGEPRGNFARLRGRARGPAERAAEAE